MRRLLADHIGPFLVAAALVPLLAVSAMAQETIPTVPESITLTRWEYLELSYRSMTCGMRCGGESALVYCDSHILRTRDGGVAEFVFWWKTSDVAEQDLRAMLTKVNAKLPVMFEQSLPVRQGLWQAGPLEDRLLIVHLDAEKGGTLGLFCGGKGGFAPEEIALVEREIEERGGLIVH